MSPRHSHIVIAGFGLGGYACFNRLAKLIKQHRLPYIITIIDLKEYFTFVPLLHEVATGALDPETCTTPIADLLKGTPHQFLQARISHIDPATHTITTDAGTLSYEYCIVGLGSDINHFGIPGAAQSLSIRTLEHALTTRTALYKELLENKNPSTITVIGGGYSGVEIASELAILTEYLRTKRQLTKPVSVQIIEAATTVIPHLSETLRTTIIERLGQIGVKLYFNTAVEAVLPHAVRLRGGEELSSSLTIWCAGVKNTATLFFDEHYTEKGRLPVNTFLQHQASDTLYVVGDMAYGINPTTGQPLPQLGAAADREGRYVAEHLAARLVEKAYGPLTLDLPGTIVPVGDYYAVAKIGNREPDGFTVWLLRRLVYGTHIPGITKKFDMITAPILRSFTKRFIMTHSQSAT